MAEAKDMRSFERAAMAKWLAESDKPPQNMHEAWSQWGGVAQMFAVVGSLFGRRTATAALGAAGEMMESANAADVKAYDQAYKRWQTHNDGMLKAVELFHQQYREIIEADDKSWDHRQAEISTLLTAAGVVSRFDEQAFAKQEQALRLAKDRAELVKLQNEESEIRLSTEEKDKKWLAEHPEAGDKVPASVHNAHIGEAKRERSGTAAASIAPEDIATNAAAIAGYQLPAPTGYASRSPRAQQIMAEVMRLNPGYSASKYAAAAATRRAFDVGRQGDQTRSLNVAMQHFDVLQDAASALQSHDTNMINRVVNYVQTELGHSEVTNFQVAAQIVADEAVKAVIGSGAVFDREGMQKQISDIRSPEQLQGILGTLRHLMAGQLKGLRRQFTSSGLPEEEFNQKLEPSTLALTDASASSGAGALPEAARGQLREGEHTTFGNGQTWTLENGTPKRIK
jgi:hypothetical protein